MLVRLRVAVVYGRELSEDRLRGRGAHEHDGTVGAEEVRAARVPAAETAVNRRVLVLRKVVVRTVDTVGERRVRGLPVVRPVGGDGTPDVAVARRGRAAEVRAVVAFRPVVRARSRRVADVKTVDRDVLLADDDLVAQTVLYFP